MRTIQEDEWTDVSESEGSEIDGAYAPDEYKQENTDEIGLNSIQTPINRHKEVNTFVSREDIVTCRL